MKLGPYDVSGEIGRGGMGVVLRGRSPAGVDVAIKLMLDASSREAVARFDRERRLQAELGEEAGFVPLIDAGTAREGAYLVMPFLTGGSLRDRLRKRAMRIDEAVSLCRRLGRALGRAHAKGIVHRDLKPENILFDDRGNPLVSDLGLAKHFRREPGAASVTLTQSGDTAGTLGYMAPEQTGRAKDVGPQADVFALGAILYECVAGKPAFAGDNAHEVLAKVSSGSYPSLRAVRPDAPRWLAPVIAAALRRDPLARPRDGDELVRALDDGPRAHRRRAIVAAGGGAALVLTIALIARAISSRPDEPPHSDVVDAPVASTTAPATPRAEKPRSAVPSWWAALAPTARPALPLPRGLRFGEGKGEYVNERDGSILLFVPGTELSLYRDQEEDPGPEVEVKLSQFFVGKYEVTVEQFERFATDQGYRTTAERLGSGNVGWGWEDHSVSKSGATWRDPEGDGKSPPAREPVVQVDWSDARAYCEWAGLSLVSESQWECAAAWDPVTKTKRKRVWGSIDETKIPAANLLDASARPFDPKGVGIEILPLDDGYPLRAPVGSFKDDLSPAGAFDMGGNVREWCLDAFEPSSEKRPRGRDPVCASTSNEIPRCVRGSSFAATRSRAVVAARGGIMSFTRRSDIGIRVARPGF